MHLAITTIPLIVRSPRSSRRRASSITTSTSIRRRSRRSPRSAISPSAQASLGSAVRVQARCTRSTHYHLLGSYQQLEVMGGPHDGEVLMRHDGVGNNAGTAMDHPVDLAALGATSLRLTCGFDNPRSGRGRLGHRRSGGAGGMQRQRGCRPELQGDRARGGSSRPRRPCSAGTSQPSRAHRYAVYAGDHGVEAVIVAQHVLARHPALRRERQIGELLEDRARASPTGRRRACSRGRRACRTARRSSRPARPRAGCRGAGSPRRAGAGGAGRRAR